MADGELQPPSPLLPEEEHFEIVLALDRDDLKLFKRDFAFDALGWGPALIIGFSYLALFVGVAGTWLAYHFQAGGRGPIIVVLIVVSYIVINGVPRYFTGPPRQPIYTNERLLVTSRGLVAAI